MPNWTFCKLKAPNSVLKKYINDKNEFDFNLVIPCPEMYLDPYLISGGDEDLAIYWYLSDHGKCTYDELPLPQKVKERYFTYFSMSYISRMDRPETAKESEALYERGSKYIYLADTYGYRDWYDWRCANWGTKWNAGDCEIYTNGTVRFNTAWAPPVPVIKKIFEDNPKTRIEFYWTNEDWDGYHHYIRYKNNRYDRLNCEGVFD